jgi:hypothetical protein
VSLQEFPTQQSHLRPLKTAVALSPNYTNVLRRLRLLGLALLVSNLFLGLYSVYLLQREDQKYAKLLTSSLPVIDRLRSMGRESGLAFRCIVVALVANDEITTVRAIGRAKAAITKENSLRETVRSAPILASDGGLFSELDAAATDFEHDARRLMERVKIDSSADEERFAIGDLSKAQDRYANATENVVSFIGSKTSSIKNSYHASMEAESVFVLGLASWPLVLGALVALATTVVLTSMLLLFGSRDANSRAAGKAS